MTDFISQCRQDAIECMAFGDLFLEDVRAYRENNLHDSGITPVFPLWNQSTDTLARKMIDGGLRARLTCIDPKKLSPAFAGREFDLSLLHDLPSTVDPCGENGEFHSFVYAGPMFNGRITIEVGDIVERDGFVFADIKMAESSCC